MKLKYNKSILFKLVSKQLSNFFSLDINLEKQILKDNIEKALLRCEKCFVGGAEKSYELEGQAFFNHFHSDQYSIFLYYLSNSLYQDERPNDIAERVYCLNKALNGLDLFYEVEMPEVFFLEHPVGSVIGRAKYGEKFRFSQNCTIGSHKGIYPIIGDNVAMMVGSKVIGDCKVGDNVIISVNSFVLNTNIPSNSLVFGSSPHLIVKSRPSSYFMKDPYT
ncbi:MAG: transferase [Candidatus Cloacimonetes bacterium]|nr:transferase [Candidatus Cloacimonadota bacterium]